IFASLCRIPSNSTPNQIRTFNFPSCTPVVLFCGACRSSRMVRYILTRLLGLLFVLFVISLITFWLMHGVPGGPWAYGQQLMSDQQLAALEARYGLDKPVWQQYLTWLGGVVRFDFGMSFEHPDESV